MNSPATVEFWLDRIRAAVAEDRHDPVRAALGYAGAAETLRNVKNSIRILDRYVRHGDRVLEIGCGCGDLYPLMPEGVDYWGIDLVPDFIEEARKAYVEPRSLHMRDSCRFDVIDIVKDHWDFRDNLNSHNWDVVVGKMVEATIGGSVGKDTWHEVMTTLVCVGRKVILWSSHHTVPSVFVAAGGKPIQTQEAK